MTKSLTYLAQPYSHPDPEVREQRYRDGCAAASRLMQQGLKVFAPIPHSHGIAAHGGLPTSWEYWESYDRTILEMCEKLLVLKLDGWEQSVGVLAEMDIAFELGIPVEYITL